MKAAKLRFIKKNVQNKALLVKNLRKFFNMFDIPWFKLVRNS